MKSSFLNQENAKVKYIELKKYQTARVLFQTMSRIDLNIYLQWWIISQSMDGFFY